MLLDTSVSQELYHATQMRMDRLQDRALWVITAVSPLKIQHHAQKVLGQIKSEPQAWTTVWIALQGTCAPEQATTSQVQTARLVNTAMMVSLVLTVDLLVEPPVFTAHSAHSSNCIAQWVSSRPIKVKEDAMTVLQAATVWMVRKSLATKAFIALEQRSLPSKNN